jgi:hypothetical protein
MYILFGKRKQQQILERKEKMREEYPYCKQKLSPGTL